MTTQERQRTLFVGVDVHKDTHTAVGVSPFGEKIFEMTIGNSNVDFQSLVERAHEEAKRANLSARFGLEDVHSWGERLSEFLVEEGLPVCAVAPVLVDRLRSTQTHPEKNDSLDALGVAKVMIQRTDSLPVYIHSEEVHIADLKLGLDSAARWFA
jgi:transposase